MFGDYELDKSILSKIWMQPFKFLPRHLTPYSDDMTF